MGKKQKKKTIAHPDSVQPTQQSGISHDRHYGERPGLNGSANDQMRDHGYLSVQTSVGHSELPQRPAKQPLRNAQAESNINRSTAAIQPLNPIAPSFVIGQSSSSTATVAKFKPYQPVRFSNGIDEKQTSEPMRAPPPKPQRRDFSTGGGGKFAQKNQQKRELANAALDFNTVVPSIEVSNPLWTWTQGDPVVEAQTQPRQHSMTPRGRTVTPPPVPIPTKAYIAQANLPPILLPELSLSRKLLIVLDLNGTLLYRNGRRSTSTIQSRPGVTILLDYLFSHHAVMVYTSARPENADLMVKRLMHPSQRSALIAIWGRDKLDLSKQQYDNKVQVYKKLEKIWSDDAIQRSGAAAGHEKWDQSNTVLIDDSHLKASSQPYNLLQVPEFIYDKPRGDIEREKFWIQKQVKILADLQERIEELGRQGDVSRQIRRWQVEAMEGEEQKVRDGLKLRACAARAAVAGFGTGTGTGVVDVPPRSPTPAGLEEASGDSDRDEDTGGGAQLRSVSPIDESIWADILAGKDQDATQ